MLNFFNKKSTDIKKDCCSIKIQEVKEGKDCCNAADNYDTPNECCTSQVKRSMSNES